MYDSFVSIAPHLHKRSRPVIAQTKTVIGRKCLSIEIESGRKEGTGAIDLGRYPSIFLIRHIKFLFPCWLVAAATLIRFVLNQIPFDVNLILNS